MASVKALILKRFTSLARNATATRTFSFADVSCQSPRPVERDGLVSELHRNSAYLCRRAALASSFDTSGHTDKVPVLIQSCRMSNVLSARLRAPTKSAWSVYWQL